MNLSALADFHRVAAAGSLGKASRESGRPKATLSRRIRHLEESLGVRLVERGHRALKLTDEGRALYERTHTLLRDIEEVGQNLASGNERPRGLLRVSAPVLFADTLSGRLAAEFVSRHPDVRLDLVANDRYVDLVDEGLDVAIRVNPHPDSDLVGRCFAYDSMLVVAPPSLRMPEATDPKAPSSVPAVVMSNLAGITPWHFDRDGKPYHLLPDYRLHLSSLAMVRRRTRRRRRRAAAALTRPPGHRRGPAGVVGQLSRAQGGTVGTAQLAAAGQSQGVGVRGIPGGKLSGPAALGGAHPRDGHWSSNEHAPVSTGSASYAKRNLIRCA